MLYNGGFIQLKIRQKIRLSDVVNLVAIFFH